MALILTNGTGGGNWADTTAWAGGVVPVSPNTAEVVIGDTIDTVPAGEVCTTNYGIIAANSGTVTTNANVVTINNDVGVVDSNGGR